jgi:hypothetical protein
MAVNGAQNRIHTVVSRWPDVTVHRHRFEGTEYRLGKRELGHIHGDQLVDLPFPKAVRDELLAGGRVRPHHVLPDSGWVSLYLTAPSDVDLAIDLFRKSYELAGTHRTGASAVTIMSGKRKHK